MEEDLLTVPPAYKLYTDRAIALATFIGGPLIAGYLAADNFKQLGRNRSARIAWLVAIGATIIIFGGLMFIPDIQNVPRYIIPLAYTGVTQLLIQRFQGQSIKTHREQGGEMYSNWRAVWIGLIGLAVLVVIALGAFFLQDSISARIPINSQ